MKTTIVDIVLSAVGITFLLTALIYGIASNL
jgi:hypothetical protein